MEKVKVELGKNSYDILIGAGLTKETGRIVADILGPESRGRACALITNETIGPLHARACMAALSGAGISPALISLPDGEEHKRPETVKTIYSDMIAAGLDRKSFVLALGGGVIGDMAGFAAASFMRGIDFFQIPTSLMAQVDSSIGGKTGVNLEEGKNLVGAFHQPRAVITDVSTLKTLPEREYISGFAEIVKHAVILDADYFAWLENNVRALLDRDEAALTQAIARSSRIKAGVVSGDERETGLRAILNYGHTVGHALESLSGYGTLLHGEAVALGMCAAAGLSLELGLADEDSLARQRSLLEAFGLPATTDRADFDTERTVYFISHDKKMKDGKLNFIALESIGRVSIQTVEDNAALARAIGYIRD